MKCSNVGSGTNVSPSKVTKTPTKPRIKKEKANRDAENYMEMEESKAHDMQLYADNDEYGYEHEQAELDEQTLAEAYQ